MKLEVTSPADFQGSIIGHLNKRGGIIVSTQLNDDGGQVAIGAEVTSSSASSFIIIIIITIDIIRTSCCITMPAMMMTLTTTAGEPGEHVRVLNGAALGHAGQGRVLDGIPGASPREPRCARRAHQEVHRGAAGGLLAELS